MCRSPSTAWCNARAFVDDARDSSRSASFPGKTHLDRRSRTSRYVRGHPTFDDVRLTRVVRIAKRLEVHAVAFHQAIRTLTRDTERRCGLGHVAARTAERRDQRRES